MVYAPILASLIVGTFVAQDPSLTPPVFDAMPDTAVKVTDLINADDTIDTGLPSTAAPGAKLPKDGDPIVIVNTTQGRFVIRLFPAIAPNNVKNFSYLSEKGFYNGTKFHQVTPDIVVGGDPNTRVGEVTTWGTGGPAWRVPDEFSDIRHKAGIVSMARWAGTTTAAGSQFFVVLRDAETYDHKNSAFGQVIEGMDVVGKIAKVPVDPAMRPNEPQAITTVEVTKWPVKLNEPSSQL